jgi:hypothetical protein
MLKDNTYTYLFSSDKIDKLASAQSFRSWAEWRLKPQSSPFSFDASALSDEQYMIPIVEPRKETLGKAQLIKQEAKFIEELMAADFSAEIDNYCTRTIEKYTAKSNNDELVCWLTNLFSNYQQNEKIVVQLLRLFSYFSYEDLEPINGVIAAACINQRSTQVQSATLSLLGHWCNTKALEILNTYAEPTDLWVKLKYDKLKEVITRRCTISA